MLGDTFFLVKILNKYFKYFQKICLPYFYCHYFKILHNLIFLKKLIVLIQTNNISIVKGKLLVMENVLPVGTTSSGPRYVTWCTIS